MGLQLQIAPGERVGGALNAQKTMNYQEKKEQILSAYKNADMQTKRALTAAAVEYLRRREKVTVTKQSLEQWRKTTANRSPFRLKYLEAYEHATKSLTPETA